MTMKIPSFTAKDIIKIAGTAGCTIVAFYFLAFVILWLGGGYVLTESGRMRLGVIAMPDIAEWQPLVGYYHEGFVRPQGDTITRCDNNGIGFAYGFFIRQVQRNHPVIRFFDDSGNSSSVAIPKGFRYHPLHGGELRGVLDASPPRATNNSPKTKT